MRTTPRSSSRSRSPRRCRVKKKGRTRRGAGQGRRRAAKASRTTTARRATPNQRVAVRDEMMRRIDRSQDRAGSSSISKEASCSSLIVERQRRRPPTPRSGCLYPPTTSTATTKAPWRGPRRKGVPDDERPPPPAADDGQAASGRRRWPPGLAGQRRGHLRLRDARWRDARRDRHRRSARYPDPRRGAGVVFFSGVMDGYGNVILIDHGNGMTTLYAHQSQLIVGWTRVSQGQVIGLAGSTGHFDGTACALRGAHQRHAGEPHELSGLIRLVLDSRRRPGRAGTRSGTDRPIIADSARGHRRWHGPPDLAQRSRR